MQKKLISIVTNTFNEEKNIKELYLGLLEQIKKIKLTADVDFEIIIIRTFTL